MFQKPEKFYCQTAFSRGKKGIPVRFVYVGLVKPEEGGIVLTQRKTPIMRLLAWKCQPFFCTLSPGAGWSCPRSTSSAQLLLSSPRECLHSRKHPLPYYRRIGKCFL